MSAWNYRIIRHHNGTFSIHEVGYVKPGAPTNCTKEAVVSADSIKELREEVDSFLRAFDRPVLNVSVFEQARGFTPFHQELFDVSDVVGDLEKRIIKFDKMANDCRVPPGVRVKMNAEVHLAREAIGRASFHLSEALTIEVRERVLD